MSGRHRTSRPHEMRRSRDGPYPRPVPRGGGGGGPIPVHAIEEEIAMRRDEFRRIRAENLHMLEDIDRLKRENSIVEHECRRLSESVPQLRAEKELEAREWIQKVLKLEAEMRSLEKVKPEVRHLRADLQRAESSKEEMAAKIKDLTGELKHLQSENDRIDDIKADIGAQRQEIDRARTALEYEKKAGAELVDHVQVMQRTLVGMAREAEQLRAELARRSSGPVSPEKEKKKKREKRREGRREEKGEEKEEERREGRREKRRKKKRRERKLRPEKERREGRKEVAVRRWLPCEEKRSSKDNVRRYRGFDFAFTENYGYY